MKNGKGIETGVFVRVFCLSAFSPANYSTSPFLSIYLREDQVTFREALKKTKLL